MKVLFGIIGLASFLLLSVLVINYASKTSYLRGYSDAKNLAVSMSTNWQTLWSLVNDYKIQHNLPTLKSDQGLCELANIRSSQVVTDWSHSGIQSMGSLRFEKYCQSCSEMGENLAKGYTSPQEVMQGWIISPSHKKLLEYPYTKGCLGYTSTEDSTYISLVVAK